MISLGICSPLGLLIVTWVRSGHRSLTVVEGLGGTRSVCVHLSLREASHLAGGGSVRSIRVYLRNNMWKYYILAYKNVNMCFSLLIPSFLLSSLLLSFPLPFSLSPLSSLLLSFPLPFSLSPLSSLPLSPSVFCSSSSLSESRLSWSAIYTRCFSRHLLIL